MLDLSYKGLLKVATPIMFGTFVQSIIVFTDSSFLGQLGTTYFNAAGIAGLLYVTFFMFFMGISDGAQILIARRNGENNQVAIGSIFQHSLVLLFTCAILAFLLGNLVLPYLLNNQLYSAVNAEGANYLSVRSYGYFFSLGTLAFQAYYVGTGKTRILIYNTLILAFLNITLDWILIFGVDNIVPALGMKGAALASVIAEIVVFLFTILYTTKNKFSKQHNLLKKASLVPNQFREILKISIPLMAQNFIALSGWTIFFLFIEQTGSIKLAASQCIRNIYFLAIVPIIGFSNTTKTYVSYLLSNNIEALSSALKKITILSYLGLLLFSHGILLYPEAIFSLLSKDSTIIFAASSLTWQIFGSLCLHNFAAILISTIAGSGNTRASMLIELGTTIIYLSISYWVIVKNQSDLSSIWAMEYLYFLLVLCFSSIYLWKTNWTKTNL